MIVITSVSRFQKFGKSHIIVTMMDSDPSAGQLSNFMISQITKSGHGRCATGLYGPVDGMYKLIKIRDVAAF